MSGKIQRFMAAVVVFLSVAWALPVLAQDLDGDGLADNVETGTGVFVSPEDTGASPYNPDTDNDGLSDGSEVGLYLTDPCTPDTDDDGLSDGDEIAYGSDPFLADSDGDGLSDGEEVHLYGTDPANPDTNGDGAPDGQTPPRSRMLLDPHPNQILPRETIYINGVIPDFTHYSSATLQITETGTTFPIAAAGSTADPNWGSFSGQITIAPGVNTLVLTVTYTTGPITETTTPVILDNSAPTITIGTKPASVDGIFIEVRGAFTKDPWEDENKIMVIVNNAVAELNITGPTSGSFIARGVVIQPDPGPATQTVTAHVRDIAGNHSEDQFEVFFNGDPAAPAGVKLIADPAAALVGNADISFTVEVKNPVKARLLSGPVRVQMDYGDGQRGFFSCVFTSGSCALPVAHTYAEARTYQPIVSFPDRQTNQVGIGEVRVYHPFEYQGVSFSTSAQGIYPLDVVGDPKGWIN